MRRSGLGWTILQPGVYVQNLNPTAPVKVPYDPHARFGFLDLADLGKVAARVLTEDAHVGATYELASRQASVAELAGEAAQPVTRVPDPGIHPWLTAMFTYYDQHGLLVGTKVLDALLERP